MELKLLADLYGKAPEYSSGKTDRDQNVQIK
jgi:hypothetical protein